VYGSARNAAVVHRWRYAWPSPGHRAESRVAIQRT
jgi:hypothetical protein